LALIRILVKVRVMVRLRARVREGLGLCLRLGYRVKVMVKLAMGTSWLGDDLIWEQVGRVRVGCEHIKHSVNPGVSYYKFMLWIQCPLEQVNIVNCRVEEVDRSCDSDVDSSQEDCSTDKYTLVVWPQTGCPIYLLLSSKQIKVVMM